MFLRIDVQKLFCANSEEDLGICVFRYFMLFPYFELFLYFVKFQETIPGKKFKIKPIRVDYTPACSALTHAGQMSPNSQVLGHRTILTITPFTGNESQVVTELLTN